MILKSNELLSIDKRLNEINSLLEFQLSKDKMNKIESELDYLIKILKESQYSAMLKEKGLRIVR